MRKVVEANNKIRSKHASRNLMAVCAVTDEAVNEAGGFGWEFQLHGAAETGGRRLGGGGPAVFCFSGERDVGLGFVGGFEGRHWVCCVVLEGL